MQVRWSSCSFSSYISLASQVDILTYEALCDPSPRRSSNFVSFPSTTFSNPCFSPVTGASSLFFNSASGPLHGGVFPGVLFSRRHGLLAQLLQIVGLGSSLRALWTSSPNSPHASHLTQGISHVSTGKQIIEYLKRGD